MAELGIQAVVAPVAQEEIVDLGAEPFAVGFRGDKLQKAERAVVAGEDAAVLHVIPRGAGKILWMPVPVELSDDVEAAAGTYARALDEAGLRPRFIVEPDDAPALIICNRFRDMELLTIVSETSTAMELKLRSAAHQAILPVKVPPQRAVHLLVRASDWTIIDHTGD
jgi:hypothetical protein